MGLSNSLPSSVLRPGVCTSATRPANPYEGQFIYETNTGYMLVYNGTTWVTPSGSASAPTTNAQLANKLYVDGLYNTAMPKAGGTFTGAPLYASDPSTANTLARKAYVDTNVNQRLKIFDLGTSAVGTTPTVASTQFVTQAGSIAQTTTSNGQIVYSFPTAFTTGVVSVVATVGDDISNLAVVRVVATSRTGFTIDCWKLYGFGTYQIEPATSNSVRVNWFAIGW